MADKNKKGGIMICGMREAIIREVQKKADTQNKKIDAAIVSRVASMTIDIIMKILRRK